MKESLKSALKEAMKARDQVRMDTIRSILSALQYEEMQKGVDDLPSDSAIAILKSELKKRREEYEFAEKAARAEAIEKLNKEISVIEGFLPSQLNAESLEKILGGLKAAEPGLNMGLAMKKLKDGYAGQYDGKMASEIAKKVFG